MSAELAALGGVHARFFSQMSGWLDQAFVM
jgi:hypothetical protein